PGASGDIILGALLDAGAPLDAVQQAIDAVGVEPILVATEQVTRHGLAATKADVKAPRTTVVRTWANVRNQLEASALDDAVKTRALDVFARLAAAEADAHRTTADQVHFHEVGALDAIADVVGSGAGLPQLGVTDACGSAIAVRRSVIL